VPARNRLRLAVGATASLLVLAGCGGGGDTANTESNPDVKAGGEIRIQVGEPRALVAGNVGETEGGAVARALWSGLVDYDNANFKLINVMADSITSSDNITWNIKIKSGWTFHNDEPVNADSYIRAWNVASLGKNAYQGGHFFERVKGYDEVAKKDSTVTEMSGLEKVSDTEFKVTLKQAFAGFPQTLGYTSFMPMAKACADDLKACDEAPIGNGPFKMDGKWEHKQQIKLARFEAYKGKKPALDRITFKIYDKIDTAYADFQANNVDLMRSTPPAKVPEARSRYGARLIEKPSPSFTFVGVPVYDPAYKNEKVRQALSLAIDRQPIIDAVFQGRFTPADSFSPPDFPGGKKGTCGFCKTDTAKAKQLWTEAGWPAGKKVELWFNAGAGHEVWMQAVGDQIKKALGVEYELKGQLQFAQYLETGDAKKFTGLYRLGWSPDYPLVENYLTPLYGTGGSSNNSGYENPTFDNKIREGDQAKTIEDANKLWAEAEAIVGKDMPVIPMWFGKTSYLHADTVAGVSINSIQGLDYIGLGLKK
jgi:oligopeptide transport system substrate-binding protein